MKHISRSHYIMISLYHDIMISRYYDIICHVSKLQIEGVLVSKVILHRPLFPFGRDRFTCESQFTLARSLAEEEEQRLFGFLAEKHAVSKKQAWFRTAFVGRELQILV